MPACVTGSEEDAVHRRLLLSDTVKAAGQKWAMLLDKLVFLTDVQKPYI